ncbi:lytic transglycosylase domain-containing protein [Nocardioides sp. HDW12B]|uniref:lytic transglycosylase domain-containing protein n=1 Tax=Nocardioides sp. HDW12B TaxID=2714939 RepID=UPI001408E2C9|nr:lytic transglycosylase domain-containing protein [Nocardioides sp. HDW12B]QIK66172.1 lytic transglycosylase domain-containing protein [Nocardioides sp. HDW12B]
MIVKRTRAAAGLATAFALIAVTAPGGPASLVSSSEPVDTVVPPTEDSADSGFATGGIDYEPSERVSVEVPAVAGRDLAAASRTVVSRMKDLEAGTISDRALGSYVFAAQAMQKADPDCQVTWSMLAAIGRIESGHGTKDGAKLRNSGKADPAIRGAVLNGRGALPKVADTDEGRFDEDRRWDRAVGPMQLLPSTWSYVGVDGDGNGKRTPDDLDDAALAVGVYLCAAADKAGDTGKKADKAEKDAAADKGMQTALKWFNPSPAYSVLATRLEAEYLEAYGVTPYSAAPGATSLQAISLIAPMAPTLTADRAVVAARTAAAVKDADASTDKGDTGSSNGNDNGNGPGTVPGGDGSTPAPTDPTDGGPTDGGTPTAPPVDVPTDEPTDPPAEEPTDPPADPPAEEPTDPPAEEPTDPPAPAATISGVLEQVDGLFYVNGTEITGFTTAQLEPYIGLPVIVTYDPDSITSQ